MINYQANAYLVQIFHVVKYSIQGNNDTSFEFNMTMKRYAASAISLNESTMWIVGGHDGNIDSFTSEFITLNQSTKGPDLPFSYSLGCMVYSNFKMYLIGGKQNGSISSEVWIMDISEEFQIIKGPSLNVARNTHSCGAITDNQENNFIVVSGGKNDSGSTLDSVEILKLTLSTASWIFGKICILLALFKG